MFREAVARRYGQALFDLAERHEIVDRLERELTEIAETLEGSQELRRVLQHPQVAGEEKKRLLQRLFGGTSSRITMNFLMLVIDRRREMFLKDIIKEYLRLVDAARNIADVQVSSAVELTPEEKEQLVGNLARATGRQVRARYTVDPELIGGVVVRIGNRVIDGSVRSKLRALRERLVAGPA